MPYLKPSSEKGFAHIALLVAAIAIIAFVLVSSSADFKDKLFATLFPNKPQSHAAEELPGSIKFVDASGSTITSTTSASVKVKFVVPNWSVGTGSTNPKTSFSLIKEAYAQNVGIGSTNPPVCEHPAPPTGCHYEGTDIYPNCNAHLVCQSPSPTPTPSPTPIPCNQVTTTTTCGQKSYDKCTPICDSSGKAAYNCVSSQNANCVGTIYCAPEDNRCKPSPTPVPITTKSIVLAEDLNFTVNKQTLNVGSSNPITYTFSNNNVGTKTLYAKFIASNDKEQNANPFPATIQLVSPTTPPSNSGFGKAVSLAGTEKTNFQYISIPSNNSLNASVNYTVEAWVKPSKTPFSLGGMIVNKSSDNSSSRSYFLKYTLWTPSSGVFPSYGYSYDFAVADKSFSNCAYREANQAGVAATETDVTSWQHVAGVINNGKISLYVNGKEVSYFPSNGVRTVTGFCNSTNPLQIGSYPSTDPNFPQIMPFDGQVDEVRISNIARYTSNFTPSKTPFSSDTNTVALYHFDGNTNDSTGNGNNGQINGNVQFVDSTIGQTTPTPTPSPTPAPFVCTACGADINKDGGVDIIDFSLLTSCMNKKSTDVNASGKSCAPMDIDGNGTVQQADYTCLQSQFGKTCPIAKTSPCTPIGDVNDDKVITDADAQAALQINARVAPYQNPTADQIKRADVNADGTVTSGDALLISRYVKGIDTTFIACSASSPKPNLAVDSITMAGDPGFQKVGESIDLDLVIKNYGNADVPADKPLTTKVEIKKPNGSTYTTACSPQLIGLIKAGVSTTQKIRGCGGNYDVAGNWSVNVTVDSANVVVESNEQDNTITRGVSVQAVPVKKVFVTSNTTNGDLKSSGSKYGLGTATSGLDGADKICQGTANIAKLGGTWKAWLSDSKTSAASRLTQNQGLYKLLNDAVVANNWTDLTDGNLSKAINITENNKQTTVSSVWTNTYTDGKSYSKDCSSWTSSAVSSFGRSGFNGATYSIWTLDSDKYCSQTAALYCFEQ